MSLFLSFLIALALTSVAEVFRPYFWPRRQGFPWQKQLFWSFLFGYINENWVSHNDDEVLARRFQKDLFFLKSLESLSFFLVSH